MTAKEWRTSNPELAKNGNNFTLEADYQVTENLNAFNGSMEDADKNKAKARALNIDGTGKFLTGF